MPTRRFLIIACLGSLVAWSCAPKRADVMLDTGATPLPVLRSLLADRSAKLHSLQGLGAISFDSPEISGTAAFSAQLKRPDSLLVFLEGPLGIDVGTLFLSRETYVVYSSMENRVFTGNPAAGSFRSVIPFELTSGQLLDAFAGVFALPDREAAVYETRNGLFYVSFPCGALTCEYWIDPDLLVVTEYRQLDAAGSVLLEARCTSITEDAGAAAPQKIVVKFPQRKRRIAIAYSHLDLNPPDVSFEYSIPQDARTSVR